MEQKENIQEMIDLLIQNKQKKSFQISGFYIEFIEKKFSINKVQAQEIINQLIEQKLIMKVAEAVCVNCCSIVNEENYCQICEEEVTVQKYYYKII